MADIEEVPQEIRDTLEFVPVTKMDQVLAAALVDPAKLDLDLKDEPNEPKAAAAQQPAP